MGILRDIIDLLHLRDQNKNLRLDTKLKERQLTEQESQIVPASVEDIKAYDPTWRRLEEYLNDTRERARRGEVISRAAPPWWLPVVALLIFVLLISAIVWALGLR